MPRISRGVAEVGALVVLLLAVIGLSCENTRLRCKNDNLELEIRILRELREANIRDKFYQYMLPQVMEGHVPIEQVHSPFPIVRPGEKIEQLEIKLPKDGSEVSAQFYVEGVIPDLRASLWIIVHPAETPTYQVQSKPKISDAGAWRVKIATEDTKDMTPGVPFQIVAVANPKAELKSGDILARWPEAEWSSQVIEVIRR